MWCKCALIELKKLICKGDWIETEFFCPKKWSLNWIKYLRSWSEPSSFLSSLLFMNGNFRENVKFFFLRSRVDCCKCRTGEKSAIVSDCKRKLYSRQSITLSTLLAACPWNLTLRSRALILRSQRRFDGTMPMPRNQANQKKRGIRFNLHAKIAAM